MTPRILIVAGSDSGGGAGIQADIKTLTMLGGHALTAITAITAQNTLGVQAVMPVPSETVVAQMRSVIDDIGIDAVKIGMIGSAQTAHAVAEVLEELLKKPPFVTPALSRGPASADARQGSETPDQVRGDGNDLGNRSIPIVFDPVMVATSGSILADADTIAAFARLTRLATVVTPNVPELEALGGLDAVRESGAAVFAKGGHADGDTVTDRLLLPNGTEQSWSNPRIDTRHTHGTGCTLASAIATGLGAGMPLAAAVDRGIAFVRASLEAAPGLGQGHGPMGQQDATGFRCPA